MKAISILLALSVILNLIFGLVIFHGPKVKTDLRIIEQAKATAKVKVNKVLNRSTLISTNLDPSLLDQVKTREVEDLAAIEAQEVVIKAQDSTISYLNSLEASLRDNHKAEQRKVRVYRILAVVEGVVVILVLI